MMLKSVYFLVAIGILALVGYTLYAEIILGQSTWLPRTKLMVLGPTSAVLFVLLGLAGYLLHKSMRK